MYDSGPSLADFAYAVFATGCLGKVRSMMAHREGRGAFVAHKCGTVMSSTSDTFQLQRHYLGRMLLT